MKSNYHVNTYLKSKSENQMNYLLIRILGEHGDFNRVNFGEALWKNVIRPSLTHACAVWMPLSSSSKKARESWQYRAAKIILGTKMNIPTRSALLLELGWEPITTFIDRSKVSYFKRLSELPDSRLCKQVYNKMIMLSDTFWNYVNEKQSIQSDPTNQNFSRKYGSITRDRLLLDVTNKSSLDLYQYFYIEPGRQVYLDNQNDFLKHLD